ncbi:MAG: SDR family NAD(P)-dependent oxidoreductase, partial [Deltaproteobacteria bacterium]|nr:SDR family NAD(P)-dependent oxidoreductase [Deltaproteobacteria bacterium]
QVKTLRNVIDLVEESKGLPGKSESEELPPSSANQVPEPSFDFIEKNEIHRFTLTVTDAPPASRSVHPPLNRVLIVIDDGRGIAQILTKKLKRRGYKFVIVQCEETIEETRSGYYPLKDISPEAIEELLQNIRQHCGPIGGLINLLPLKRWTPYQDIDMAEWKNRLHLEIGTLFHFLKFLENDPNQAAKEDGACVVSTTGMGGNFASVPTNSQSEFFPGHGAISGFLKTLDMEWTDVRVKVLDLCLDEPVSSLADYLFAEIESDDDLVEVGYDGSRRNYLGLAETTLLHRTETFLEIDSSWVILVTGGARGITAEIACEIAQRYRPTMILAGRSPLPCEEESKETARFVQPQELKSAIIAGMKSRGESVSLPEVEAAYHRLCKEREIRSNLTSMRQAGAQASYFQVDVRNEQQFADLIDNIYQTYGRIDGVIHGAGVIEDKLFKDKTWASFDRVFGTKTESVFVLSKKLRPDTLKFLAFFSSVAGRFGNVGQSDYTAANDVLNKLACYLNERWPARVFSINWGPWAGGGMASEEVQRQFANRGVDMISPEEGPRYFDLEILKGVKGEVELVVGEGPWRKLTCFQYPVSTEENALPLLQSSTEVSKTNGSLEIIRGFDPSQDLYLLDHRLEGKPVLPAAMAIEFMAEASQLACPGWNVTEIKDIRVLKGIVLAEGAAQVRLLVRPEGKISQQQDHTRLGITITDTQRPELAFYKSTVVLSRPLPFSEKR